MNGSPLTLELILQTRNRWFDLTAIKSVSEVMGMWHWVWKRQIDESGRTGSSWRGHYGNPTRYWHRHTCRWKDTFSQRPWENCLHGKKWDAFAQHQGEGQLFILKIELDRTTMKSIEKKKRKEGSRVWWIGLGKSFWSKTRRAQITMAKPITDQGHRNQEPLSGKAIVDQVVGGQSQQITRTDMHIHGKLGTFKSVREVLWWRAK